MQLRGWSSEVTLFTDNLCDDVRRRLLAANARIRRWMNVGKSLPVVTMSASLALIRAA